MYVGGFEEKNIQKKDDRVKDFFMHDQVKKERLVEEEKVALQEEEDVRKMEVENEKRIIASYSKSALCHWQAPEFEARQRDKRWFVYLALALMAIIGYAVYANSPIMAITFILIGVVGYTYIEKEPRILDFMITEDGIVAGKEIFEYERIKSFWIFYEEDGSRVVSLHMKSLITPYMHIPIGEEDPTMIREALLENVEEIEQEHNIVDTLERFFGI
jgi:hypothetical protein